MFQYRALVLENSLDASPLAWRCQPDTMCCSSCVVSYHPNPPQSSTMQAWEARNTCPFAPSALARSRFFHPEA